MLGVGRWFRALPGVVWKSREFQRSGLACAVARRGNIAGAPLPSSRILASLPRACSTYNTNVSLVPTTAATISCTGDVADGIMEALMSFGASSVSIENGELSKANQENLSGPAVWSDERRQLWDQCRLIALFPSGHDVHNCLALAFSSVGLKEKPPYDLSEIQHQNWEQEVKDLFHPFKVSDSLWIVPQWSSPPDPFATNVILDPGLAFGTGDHPTTQLCLRWLNDMVQNGDTILDYGVGSGILAITALKLGASQAVGVDIDPIAITSAKHNASLNGFGPDLLRLHIAPSSGNELIPIIDAEYDIVVANLLLNPLLLLSKCLLTYTRPGGRLCLSGILESQVDQVQETYSLHVDSVNVQIKGGWACLSGVRS